MKSDFHDVGLKFESVKKEIDGLKNSSDSIDKKLQEMYYQQMNKITLGYDSVMKIINSKKYEITKEIEEFYHDARQKQSRKKDDQVRQTKHIEKEIDQFH